MTQPGRMPHFILDDNSAYKGPGWEAYTRGEIRAFRNSVGVCPGELEKTPEHLEMIKRVYQAVGEMGDDIGEDLRSRLPPLSQIHFFATPEESHAAIESTGWMDHTHARAEAIPHLGIFMAPGSDLVIAASFLAHELMHDISMHRVTLSPVPPASGEMASWPAMEISAGDADISSLWEELMSDMAMVDVMQRAQYTQWLITYPELIAVGIGLAHSMAAEQTREKTPNDVYHTFLKSKFGRQRDVLNDILTFLGQEHFELLMQTNPRELDATTANALLRELGLTAISNIVEIVSGGLIHKHIKTYMPWLSAPKSLPPQASLGDMWGHMC